MAAANPTTAPNPYFQAIRFIYGRISSSIRPKGELYAKEGTQENSWGL
jgi:hypothetical protein